MPRASPIAVIMLTMKKDSEVNCPSTEEMATVTMIEPMAMAHRDEGGHQGSEDQDEHDHRGGQPELQLSVGEVGLRELVEVVVEGVARR